MRQLGGQARGHRRVGRVAASVRALAEVEQAAPVVDHGHLGATGVLAGGEGGGEPAEEARLARLGVAEHEEVRVAAGEVEVDRLEPQLVHADRDPRRGVVARPAAGPPAPPAGAASAPAAPGSRPSARPPRATASRSASAAWKWRPSGASPRPGHVGGQHLRDAAAVLRVDRVVQAQLQPAADVVAQVRTNLGPAVGGEEHVDAEVEAGVGDLLDLEVEPVEVAAKRRPVVDHEEHVRQLLVRARRGRAAPARRASRRARAGGTRAHAPRAGPGRGGRSGAGARGRAWWPRRPRAARPRAPPARRRPGRCSRRAPRPGRCSRASAVTSALSRRALPGLRRADDGEVSSRAGEVERERVGALLGGQVEQADGGAERGLGAVALPPRRAARQLGGLDRGGQRRHPDLVHGPAPRGRPPCARRSGRARSDPRAARARPRGPP